jgi:hypothetical protein
MGGGELRDRLWSTVLLAPELKEAKWDVLDELLLGGNKVPLKFKNEIFSLKNFDDEGVRKRCEILLKKIDEQERIRAR